MYYLTPYTEHAISLPTLFTYKNSNTLSEVKPNWYSVGTDNSI